MPKLNKSLVDKHRQLFPFSCIPMAVELVLKLLGRGAPEYYELQQEWRNKSDGGFAQFDGHAIAGVTFHRRFGDFPRGPSFPLGDLFVAIERELKAGRFVIISLPAAARGWHMYLVYSQADDGDFRAVSKNGELTEYLDELKSVITRMNGTDILTYECDPDPKPSRPIQ